MVRAICNDHTRCLAHAQDVSQEVFMKAYCRLGALRDPDRFAAWLVGIARNECRDWHRRRSRDRHEFVEKVPDVVNDVMSSSHEKSPADLLETMRLLPERERLALHSFYLQGESADTIQALLGMSTSGVYRLIDRARNRLAALLDQAQEEAL
jgi:RNA polymerase sigma-70 factor (ECF subfamily)